MKTPFVPLGLALSCFIHVDTGYASPPSAATPTQMLNPATNGFQGFGVSVALDGETLIIGAPYTDTFITGAAYVYENHAGRWELRQRLDPPGPASTFRYFGDNVALHRDTAVVGLGSESGGPLATYVFVRGANGWILEQTLPMSGQVAVHGDTIVVGNYGASVGALDEAGLAQVYVRSNHVWSLQQQLIAADRRPYDHFGEGVTIQEETIVVGAIGDRSTSDESGAAYVFTRTGARWSQSQKLRAADPQPDADFGRSLAMRDDLLVVGASGYLDFYNSSGHAYVFTRNNGVWAQRQRLSPSDPAAKDSFGISVACTPTQILVGQLDRTAREGAAPSGAAYVFKPIDGQWVEQGKLDPNAGSRSLFRVTTAASGDTILVGAPWIIGSAFVYERLVLVHLRPTSPGAISLSFATDPGRTYTVEAADSPESPDWISIRTLTGTGAALELPLEVTAPHRFYRVILAP